MRASLKLKNTRLNKGFCHSGFSLRARIGDKIFRRHALHFALTLFAANACRDEKNFAQMTVRKARRHPESIKNERISAG
jgi:hypothetical protein